METSIDDNYFGCWSGRTLNFKESAIENSSLILKFKRKMQWHDEMQEFRYYFNKENKMRIIMLDSEKEDKGTGFLIYVTNLDFFSKFACGMKKYGEIEDKDFSIIEKFLIDNSAIEINNEVETDVETKIKDDLEDLYNM